MFPPHAKTRGYDRRRLVIAHFPYRQLLTVPVVAYLSCGFYHLFLPLLSVHSPPPAVRVLTSVTFSVIYRPPFGRSFRLPLASQNVSWYIRCIIYVIFYYTYCESPPPQYLMCTLCLPAIHYRYRPRRLSVLSHSLLSRMFSLSLLSLMSTIHNGPVMLAPPPCP